MYVTNEELNQVVENVTQALDRLYDAINYIDKQYGAKTLADGTSLDVAIVTTWGDKDEVREFIIEAIEASGGNVDSADEEYYEDDKDSWKFN